MNWFSSLLGKSPRGAVSSGSPGEAGRAENRYDGRIRPCRKLRISWQDHRGEIQRKLVRVVDMSGSGVMIQCSVPIDPGSFVYLRTPEFGMTGSAHVRRCDPRLFSYRIGLQFEAPLMARF
jgi:hypothetical protein